MASFPAFDPWAALEKATSKVAVNIGEDFTDLLISVNRKMVVKRTFQNSRQAIASIRMRYREFLEVYHVMKDLPSKYGVEIYSAQYKTKKELKWIKILLTNRKRVVNMLEKFGVDTEGLMEKLFGENFVGEIVVSDEKPFEISYTTSSKTASFKAHYQVTNEFGVVV